MTSCAILPLLILSALFDVRSIPLDDPSALVLLAGVDGTGRTGVFVLNGHALTVYCVDSSREPKSVMLAEGTSGFDIADLDGSGFAQVVAVCGDAVMSYRFVAAGEPPEATTLFRLDTQLSAPSIRPYPYVIAVRDEDADSESDTFALALPCKNTFELRRLDGSLISSWPMGSDSAHRISYGSPFSATWIDRPLAGPDESIEAQVTRVISFEPELPPELASAAAQPSARHRWLVDARQAASTPPERWPWFPINTDGTTSTRALYALAAPDYRDLVVRVRESRSEDVDLRGKNVVIGPERLYPGALCVPQEDLPDFNGDGYADLLLWHAPEPGLSVDSLMRVVLRRKWKLNLTAHLFNPEKNRFEPRAASGISLWAPVDWFASMPPSGPLRHMVLRDFDGNGRTDVGCAVSPNHWSVWLFGEDGFSSRPDFAKKFDEHIERVEFRAALDSGTATTVGLRTRNWLHLLVPSQAE